MARRGRSDGVYKAAYSHRRMVADALRHLARRSPRFDSAALAALDLRTLGRVPSQWVTREFRRRLGDQVWRVAYRREGARHGPVRARECLFVLLEFQSRPDPTMAWRMVEYTVELYRALEAEGAIARWARPPAVLPVVVYNGRRPWTAPEDAVEAWTSRVPRVVREALGRMPFGAFERIDLVAPGGEDSLSGNAVSVQVGVESALAAGDARGLMSAVSAMAGVKPVSLRRTLLEWVRQLDERHGLGLERLLEEWREMGSLDTFDARLLETVDGWTKQWFEQGVEQGMERGIAGGRALLVRQATRRFGTETGERLSALLAGVSDPVRLAEVGDGVLDCATGAELLRLAERERP